MQPHDQKEFSSALFNSKIQTPRGVINPDGTQATKRFDIYRNNVVSGLIEAMRDGFPLCEKIVGTEFFAAMAKEYVTANPPQTPLMYEYGEDFADYIHNFKPANSVPYLADIARVEWFKRKAYFAADTNSTNPTWFQSLSETQLLNTRGELPSDLFTVDSQFPIHDIWLKTVENLNKAIAARSQCILISRPADIVNVSLAPSGMHQFIIYLQQNHTIEGAVSATLQDRPDADIPNILGQLLPRMRAFTS